MFAFQSKTVSYALQYAHDRRPTSLVIPDTRRCALPPVDQLR